MGIHSIYVYTYVYIYTHTYIYKHICTRETAAFGGSSLAFRGRGAFGGGERKKKKWGVMGAPYLGRRGCPGRVVSLAYAAFGGDKKKIVGAFGAPNGFKKRNPYHEDSKYELGFEIGQQESGAPTALHVPGAFGDPFKGRLRRPYFLKTSAGS